MACPNLPLLYNSDVEHQNIEPEFSRSLLYLIYNYGMFRTNFVKGLQEPVPTMKSSLPSSGRCMLAVPCAMHCLRRSSRPLSSQTPPGEAATLTQETKEREKQREEVILRGKNTKTEKWMRGTHDPWLIEV